MNNWQDTNPDLFETFPSTSRPESDPEQDDPEEYQRLVQYCRESLNLPEEEARQIARAVLL